MHKLCDVTVQYIQLLMFAVDRGCREGEGRGNDVEGRWRDGQWEEREGGREEREEGRRGGREERREGGRRANKAKVGNPSECEHHEFEEFRETK